MNERGNQHTTVEVGNWDIQEVPYVYSELCVKNWAPWMVAPMDSIIGRVNVFTEGQLLARNEKKIPIGYAFINQINWNGQNQDLKSWREIAGEPTTFEDTYSPDGNTLVLMSINVHSDFRGIGVARKLIENAKSLANRHDIDFLIGSFRPNQYGAFKIDNPGFSDFEAYCRMVKNDGLPIDEWLRNLTLNGMRIIKEDTEAMIGNFSVDEFNNFRAK